MNRQHNGQKKTVQKDKQRSTKHTYKTKDRVTRTPLKTGSEHRCSGRVSSSSSMYFYFIIYVYHCNYQFLYNVIIIKEFHFGIENLLKPFDSLVLKDF